MGLLSSSKKSTTNVVNETQTIDQSNDLVQAEDEAIAVRGNANITLTDAGAIDKALDFAGDVADDFAAAGESQADAFADFGTDVADAAFDFAGDQTDDVIGFATDQSQEAFGAVSDATSAVKQAVSDAFAFGDTAVIEFNQTVAGVSEDAFDFGADTVADAFGFGGDAFETANQAIAAQSSIFSGVTQVFRELAGTLQAGLKSAGELSTDAVKQVSETVRSANTTTNEKLVTNAMIAIAVVAGVMVLPQIVRVFKS